MCSRECNKKTKQELNSNSLTLPIPSTPASVVHDESSEAPRVSQVKVSITEFEPR